MALGSTTNAGAVDVSELVPTQVATVLIQPLEKASRFLASGPRIIDTAGPLRVPMMAAPTDQSANWVGQNELIPESSPDFGELSLLPSTMKAIKTLTRFSNELSRQTVIALDAAIKDRLVADVAYAMDGQLFSPYGDGITKPQGMLAWAGTQSTPAAGALDLDDLLAAEALALAENVNPSGLRWFMRAQEFAKLRALKDTTNRYQLTPDPTEAATFRLLGYPVVITPALPLTTGTPNTANAVLADMSQVVVARDVAPSVKILTETFGQYDQQAIRVVYRLDAKPANPKAIVRIPGITL